MDLQEFLSLVTPDEGFRFVIGLQQESGKPSHYAYTTVEQAQELIEASETIEDRNTYFSCASFNHESYINEKGKKKRRTQEDALSARAIWRDLDVGKLGKDGKLKPDNYETQPAALAAIVGCCETFNLPHPLVVSSGNGIHAYWLFTRNVPAAEWQRIARVAAQVLPKGGLKSDPSRDCDIASILRPIGCVNKGQKAGMPHFPVEVLSPTIDTIDPDDFLALLTPHYTTTTYDADVPSYMQGQGATAGSLAATLSNLNEYPPAYAEIIAGKCAQIKSFSETGGTTYDAWWLGLGLVKHTVEGEEKAHEWAAKHAEYSKRESQFKLDEWEMGPPTCERYGLDSEECKACQFKGKVKSPISLGLKEKTEDDEPEMVAVESDGEIDDLPEDVHIPFPYCVQNNVIKVQVKKDGIVTYESVSSSVFWFEDRYRSLTGEMVFKTVTKVRETKDKKWQCHTFELPASVVGKGGSELYGKLGEREIFPTSKGARPRMDAMVVAMANDLRKRKAEVQAYRHFGWHDDGGFLIGGQRIDKDGEKKVLIAGDSAPSLMSAFRSNGGSAGEWSEIVEEMYSHPGHVAYQTIVMFGIGSPLLKFYQMPTGCLVNMVGGRGLGKTTVARIGLSAYGNPDGLMTELRSTTELALYDRIATHHSIPINIDELTNIEPLKMSNMTYNIMNGQPRERLKQNGQRTESILPWQTVSFASANGSIREVVAAFKADASAELSRLIEIDWPEDVQTIERREMDALLVRLREHYGAMGKAFVTWICQNERKAERAILKMREYVEDELKIGKENRYWSAHIAVPLATKLILEKMGYLDSFSFDEMQTLCLSTIREHKEEMSHLTLDNKEAFHAMLTFMSDKIITTKVLKDSRWATPDAVHINGEPVGRAVLEENDLYLSIAAVREWCSVRRVNYKKLCKELESLEILKGTARFYFGRGTTRMTGQIYSLHLDLKRVLGFSHAKADVNDKGHLQLVRP